MSKTPLRLEKYFFTTVTLKANPNFKYEDFKDHKMDFSVKTNVRGGAHKIIPNKFQITLDVKTEQLDERPLPYDVSLTLVGFFEVDPTITAPSPAELVRVTGSSILYSAAREFLLSIMGRGPWEPMMLPTISFANIVSKEKDKTETTSKV
jgi:preprotein translocase subunit SecB